MFYFGHTRLFKGHILLFKLHGNIIVKHCDELCHWFWSEKKAVNSFKSTRETLPLGSEPLSEIKFGFSGCKFYSSSSSQSACYCVCIGLLCTVLSIALYVQILLLLWQAFSSLYATSLQHSISTLWQEIVCWHRPTRHVFIWLFGCISISHECLRMSMIGCKVEQLKKTN